MPVAARCIDREIRRTTDPDSSRDVWLFRLLCAFVFEEQEYLVTPESVKECFDSEGAVRDYLDQRIDAEGNCRLYIDPKNLLHAVFHSKRRMPPCG